MIDPYDPEGFRAAGHAVIDQLGDYLAGTGRSAGPVLRRSTSSIRAASADLQTTRRETGPSPTPSRSGRSLE
jgi:hypothetical protein